MQIISLDEKAVESCLDRAEALMAAGRWMEAESIIRECCPIQADLTLRLAQLEMRRECARYAHVMLMQCGGKADGIQSYKQALSTLEEKFDYYSALWVLTKYKGE